MYKRLGGSRESIEALADFESSELFPPADKAALRFAESMTRDAHSVTDEIFSDLADHFDDGEIVELASVIGLFNYFNRWNDALRTEPTR